MRFLRPALCALLMLCLSLPACAETLRFDYGSSEQGRPLTCVRIGPEEADRRMLMTFATHGFEGAAYRDGQYLVDIANALIAHYEAHPEALCGYALYIVPCVNPDGLAEGTTEDGFGRANANGLDINRDFPEKWKYKRTNRWRTGDAPFATAEARAVRDLVAQVQPTCAVDVHGWIRGVYGSEALAKPFRDIMKLEYRKYSGNGMLSQWMETQCEDAILVELPNRPASEGYVQRMTQSMIECLDLWFGGV